MFVVAHVSDTHFGNDVQDPAARNRAVMDHLLAMTPPPDLLVVTGDIADHGLPHEYAEARAWLDRWPGPTAVCPGNHDVRLAYAEGLGIDGDGLGARTVVEHGGFRFVMLDSLVDAGGGGRVDEGRLGAEQLDWLDRQLGASDDPAFVCLHHPPATIGLELMDPIRLMDADDLAAVLDHHPQVVAVLVGHAHTMGTTEFAGRPLLIGGGVVSTVTLDAEQVDTVWYSAPPTFALHLVDGDRPRVATHWRARPRA
jgi:3',5'-cyclic AMP phosphodiesterase CpdA